MKALTLWQPWATLIAIGAKKIETRPWSTRYRGPLAIHAAKTQKMARYARLEPFCSALEAGGYNPFQPLPSGVVVATCQLVDCKQVTSTEDWPESPEVEFGDYGIGRWMWFLDEIEALPDPVPARGRQR